VNPVVADQGLLRLHWSSLILEEMSRALVDTGRKKTLAEARVLEDRLNEALPAAMIDTHDVQRMFASVQTGVRSAKDVHVAASAQYLLHAKAYPGVQHVVLVTRNVRDFKVRTLQAMGIEVRRPDDFLSDLLSRSKAGFIAAFRHFRQDLTSRPDPQAMLDALRRDGLEQTGTLLSVAMSSGARL
jgi:hypothetical protein